MKELLPGLFMEIYQTREIIGEPLNLYIVRPENSERSLMIDCGYNTESCKSEIERIVKELQIDYHKLDVFITHNHPDHSGQAEELYAKGATIYMNPVDEAHKYDLMHCYMAKDDTRSNTLRVIGVTEETTPDVYKTMMQYGKEVFDNEMMYYDFPFKSIEPGQWLHYGEYTFQVIGLRGHTYGQIGLVDKKHKILFCADQVIKGLVPIVGYVKKNIPLLEYYLSSLDILKHEYKDFTFFPSHNEIIKDVEDEVNRIIFGYLDKCDIMLHVLKNENKEMTVREVAVKSYGRSVLPPSKEKFRSCVMIQAKTFACLEYLYDEGFIQRREQDGIIYWKYSLGETI